MLAAVIARAGEQRAEGVTQMGNGATPLLLIYLLTRIPAGRRIAPVGECDHGVGLVDPASGSIALLTVPSPWGPGRSRRDDRVRWRLHAYSGGAAATEMEGLLAGWGELVDRCDGDQPRLRLTAYGRAERAQREVQLGVSPRGALTSARRASPARTPAARPRCGRFGGSPPSGNSL